eukprot:Skav231560  [mRNA]  locus=scaffold481:100857:102394:+ [translate_table: standard]
MDALQSVDHAKTIPIMFWNFSSSHCARGDISGKQLIRTEQIREMNPISSSKPMAVLPMGTYGFSWPSTLGI